MQDRFLADDIVFIVRNITAILPHRGTEPGSTAIYVVGSDDPWIIGDSAGSVIDQLENLYED